jgi:hypothetical protein
MTDTNIFEQASRDALRFPSVQGELTTEQLWKLPLTSRSGNDLNTIAVDANRALRSVEEENFVSTKSNNPMKATYQLRLDIAKHIIGHKQAAAAAQLAKADKAIQRAKLIEQLGKKQDAALEGLSEEEIKKQLAALDD